MPGFDPCPVTVALWAWTNDSPFHTTISTKWEKEDNNIVPTVYSA